MQEDDWERRERSGGGQVKEGDPKRIISSKDDQLCLPGLGSPPVESKPFYPPENRKQGITHVLTGHLCLENAVIGTSLVAQWIRL